MLARARRSKVSKTKVEKDNMVQCDKCKKWKLFEKSGIEGKFDAARIEAMKFECRFCKLDRSVFEVQQSMSSLSAAVTSLERRFGNFSSDIVARLSKLELKVNVELDFEVGQTVISLAEAEVQFENDLAKF